MLINFGQRHVAMRETGIIDHDVDAAKLVECCTRQPLHVVLARNISLHRQSILANIGNFIVKALHIHIGKHNLCTLGCKASRYGRTEARSCTSNNRNLVLQPLHVILLLRI